MKSKFRTFKAPECFPLQIVYLNYYSAGVSFLHDYACTTCGQAFPKPGTLTAHMRTHTGDRTSLQPSTMHPAPRTQHPAPSAQHPAPCILHSAPCTQRPAPCTLHHSPCTLHPAPCTLHLNPYPLTSNPFTLHPTPRASRQPLSSKLRQNGT